MPLSAMGVLWGKSNAAGRPMLLLQHLLDSAAVGELIWDRFLAPGVRRRIDAVCGGRGRLFVALLCALHDVGKASPAFQVKDPLLAGRVRAAGLMWPELGRSGLAWHHTVAGAVIVRRTLPRFGCSREVIDWVWPLVAGHHGVVPGSERLTVPERGVPQHGTRAFRASWEAAQDDLMRRVFCELDVTPVDARVVGVPSRSDQLALVGIVIMADWVASDSRHFGGVESLDAVSMSDARGRAETAWTRLGLRGGWDPAALSAGSDPVAERFGVTTRPAQADVVAMAETMPAPGLLLVEAPMGEGKTETALAAAEVFGRRFGGDGVFVGMPTQATCDPMFTRVRAWAGSIDPGVPVGLLHGRRQFNREWSALIDRSSVSFDGIDEFGDVDRYGVVLPATEQHHREAPAEWFLGRKRGLLVPVTVGTIDQLLHAATRTRHVMLRHAGLVGRVVILDEVHAYDVYMSQFLFEALRWLADARVPVVLLSATLPPSMREDLARAYLQGALAQRDVTTPGVVEVEGYPTVSSVCVVDDEPRIQTRSSRPWRRSMPVQVEVVDEPSPAEGDLRVVSVLSERLAEGGCALVVRNTVARAQQTYRALRGVFGADVVLLHARLVMAERVERAERMLNLLGPPGKTGASGRPDRLIVVATQVAEQSFDVDADLLVTDLAPIDLLLQRVGRLHRHERPATARPAPVRVPRIVVTGLDRRGEQPPVFPRGSALVYGDHMLLRAAALVNETAASGWTIPTEVPGLVARGYGEESLGPRSWQTAAAEAERRWREERARRKAAAEGFLLSGPDHLGMPTLAGLHRRSTEDLPTDEDVAAVVRDGEPSVDVVLVRRRDHEYLSLDGRRIGPTGEAVSDPEILEHVAGATLRLPARPDLTAAALAELRPLPGWTGDPWLGRTRALVLDEAMSARLGGHQLTYDHELGLIDVREAHR